MNPAVTIVHAVAKTAHPPLEVEIKQFVKEISKCFRAAVKFNSVRKFVYNAFHIRVDFAHIISTQFKTVENVPS